MKVEFCKDIQRFKSGEARVNEIVETIIQMGENNDEIREQLDELAEVYVEDSGDKNFLKVCLKHAENKLRNHIIERKLQPRFTFTKDDFLNGTEPYDYVFWYLANTDKFVHEQEVSKMAEEARKAKFTGFKKQYQEYCKRMRQVMAEDEEKNIRPTRFPNQPIELDAGTWVCDAEGVRQYDYMGTQVACCHPIVPVARLVNIDTFEEKITLAFLKSSRWRTITVPKEIVAVASKITQLSANGVAVTSENAKTLVRYLCDIENRNLKAIPEKESVSRLGFVEEGKFSPYVDDLIFDGDAAYSMIFKAIKESRGNREEWIRAVKRLRSESLVSRIMISASFASVLVKKIGGLPFFVHLWSCESGTGKTVALMAAASVWGNPEPGTYIQSFNSTSVGHEKMAAFLNNVPMCIDELQLSKDTHGRSKFDVYALAQGVGRTRGNKSGGVDRTPTWSNTILTTGESPIVKDSAGAGAVNRVIDLEVPIGQKVVTDGQGTANAVKSNYGFAGREFVEKADFEKAKQLYGMYFETLNNSDTTEKQSMAAAMILAADGLVSQMFFDEQPMAVSDMQQFLKSKSSVSVGERGYQYMCDWVSMNIRNFISNAESSEMPAKIYGMKGGVDSFGNEWIFINQSIFRTAAEEGGYDSRSLLSYLRSKGLIQSRPKKMTKDKRIAGIHVECVILKLPEIKIEDADENDEQMID